MRSIKQEMCTLKKKISEQHKTDGGGSFKAIDAAETNTIPTVTMK